MTLQTDGPGVSQYLHFFFKKCRDTKYPLYCLVCWLKISADNILRYFYYFCRKVGFDIACKLPPLETICLQSQTLVSGKCKQNTI